MPTFEEFYASVNGGKKPSGFTYEVLRASSDPLVAMFRTALYTTLGAIGLTGFAATAEAHPPIVRPVRVVGPVPVVTALPVVTQYYPAPGPVCHSWMVLYRGCDYEPWHTYASYGSVDAARHAARYLRHTGYHTRVAVG